MIHTTLNLKKTYQQHKNTGSRQNSRKAANKNTEKVSKKKTIEKIKTTKNNISQDKRPKEMDNEQNNQNHNCLNINLQEKQKERKNTDRKQQVRFKKENNGMKREKSQKLFKSKSMVRLQSRERLSPSPLHIHYKEIEKEKQKNPVSIQQQKKQNFKKKIQKTKMRKSTSKHKLRKFQQNELEKIKVKTNKTSVHTELCQKNHSLFRPKTSKSNFIPKSSKIKSKIKHLQEQIKSKVRNQIQKSILYEGSLKENGLSQFQSIVSQSKQYFLSCNNHESVKTEGCQIERVSFEPNQLYQKSVTMIQKNFRGYITRKYINQAKFIIGKVKLIQRWWRKNREKGIKEVKAIQIQNSLITIKDFNQSIKQERAKFLSDSKEVTLSSKKINLRQIMKNIAQEIDENQSKEIQTEKEEERPIMKKKQMKIQVEQQNNDSSEKKVEKDVYIERKIKTQIASEKVFNSPRQNESPINPRTPSSLNMKQLFNKSFESNRIREFIASPKNISPLSKKYTNTPKRMKEQSQKSSSKKENNNEIESFQTNFSFIEQFGFLMLEYLKFEQQEFNKFMEKCQKLKYSRTFEAMKTWHQFKELQIEDEDEDEDEDEQKISVYQDQPQVFSSKYSIIDEKLRLKILRNSTMIIFLSQKGYNFNSEISRQIQLKYLEFIFDCFEEGFLAKYSSTYLSLGEMMGVKFSNRQQNYHYLFSSAFGAIHEWADSCCGCFQQHPERQAINQIRQSEMIKKVKTQQNYSFYNLCLKIEIAQSIFENLVEQFFEQS